MVTDEMIEAFSATVIGYGGNSFWGHDGRIPLDGGALEVRFMDDGVFEFDVEADFSACGIKAGAASGLLRSMDGHTAFIRRCVEIIESFKQNYRDNLAEIVADEDEMGDE